jgi:glycogen phosphorylase
MVQEYTERCYVPSAERFARLTEQDLQRAGKLSQWRKRLLRDWGQIKVEQVEAKGGDTMQVGAELEVQARVNLGQLSPDDVEVQLFHGAVDNAGEIARPMTLSMSTNGATQGSTWLYKGMIPCKSSGHYGYAVRVLPRNADLAHSFEPGVVCWG